MNRPRALIIENSLDFTGGLNSVLRSCELLKTEFDFCFLLPTGSKSAKYVMKNGFVVYELPMKEIRKSAGAMLLYFLFLMINTIRLINLLKTARIDLMVSNDFYNMTSPLYKLMGGRIPYVCYVRFRPSKFPGMLVQWWSWMHDRYAATIISVSEIVKRELPHRRKVVVIKNEFPNQPVDLIASTSKTILYPANYIEGKGQAYALQSFAVVHRQFPGWKLRFVGGEMGLDKNRSYKKRLVEQSVSMGLQEGVEWEGFSEHMDREYLNASIVLNFSESESFSLTCLEAMYYGRTVIATKSGGPQEILSHVKNGVLVNVGDVQSMTLALLELIGKPDKRNAMGAQAYHDVRVRFDLEKIQNRLSSVYGAALISK